MNIEIKSPCCAVKLRSVPNYNHATQSVVRTCKCCKQRYQLKVVPMANDLRVSMHKLEWVPTN